MDGSRIRKEKVADSKISGYVWTGPNKKKSYIIIFAQVVIMLSSDLFSILLINSKLCFSLSF